MNVSDILKALAALTAITFFTGCDDDEVTYQAPAAPVREVHREVHTSSTVAPDPYAASTTTRRTTTSSTGYVAPVDTTVTQQRRTTTVY